MSKIFGALAVGVIAIASAVSSPYCRGVVALLGNRIVSVLPAEADLHAAGEAVQKEKANLRQQVGVRLSLEHKLTLVDGDIARLQAKEEKARAQLGAIRHTLQCERDTVMIADGLSIGRDEALADAESIIQELKECESSQRQLKDYQRDLVRGIDSLNLAIDGKSSELIEKSASLARTQAQVAVARVAGDDTNEFASLDAPSNFDLAIQSAKSKVATFVDVDRHNEKVWSAIAAGHENQEEALISQIDQELSVGTKQ